MKTTAILSAHAAALCAGCSTPAAVVTTEISVSKADGTLHVSSPKNVAIEGLEAVVAPDGSRTVKLAKYSATADPAIAEAVRAQSQALADIAKAAK